MPAACVNSLLLLCVWIVCACVCERDTVRATHVPLGSPFSLSLLSLFLPLYIYIYIYASCISIMKTWWWWWWSLKIKTKERKQCWDRVDGTFINKASLHLHFIHPILTSALLSSLLTHPLHYNIIHSKQQNSFSLSLSFSCVLEPRSYWEVQNQLN